MINKGSMNDSSIRQKLKNFLLFFKKLFDLLTLKESCFGGLDRPTITDEDNWLHNHNKNEIVKPNSIVPNVNMTNLDGAVDKQLEPH